MTQTLKQNKFIAAIFVIAVVFAGMTFGNLPDSTTNTNVQTINGVTFKFSDYRALNREQIGVFNYFDTIVSNQAQNEWNGWHNDGWLVGMRHYFAAFTMYVISALFETTPGYRTSHYQDFAESLVMKMNTTIEEYGTESIEYWEWGRTSYPDYYYPDPNDPSGLPVGGFRGPANNYVDWSFRLDGAPV